MSVFRLGGDSLRFAFCWPPSIGVWHQQGHVFQMGVCASKVMAFDSGILGLGSQHVVSFDWAWKQQVVPFDWGLALVTSCPSIGWEVSVL